MLFRSSTRQRREFEPIYKAYREALDKAVDARAGASGADEATQKNTADKRGGGVFTNMTLTISDGITITGNKSEQGGGIYTYDEDITINGGNITGNTATYGGGVYHIGDYRTCDTLTISGSATITGNTATDGGGVYVESGKKPPYISII